MDPGPNITLFHYVFRDAASLTRGKINVMFGRTDEGFFRSGPVAWNPNGHWHINIPLTMATSDTLLVTVFDASTEDEEVILGSVYIAIQQIFCKLGDDVSAEHNYDVLRGSSRDFPVMTFRFLSTRQPGRLIGSPQDPDRSIPHFLAFQICSDDTPISEFTRHSLRLKKILRGDTFLLSLTQNQYHEVRNRIISFEDVHSRISLTYLFANLLDSEFTATSDKLTYVYSRQLFNDFAIALGALSPPLHISLALIITLQRDTNPSKTIRLDAIASFFLGRYKDTHDTCDLTLAIFFLQTVHRLRLGPYADDFVVDHFGMFSCSYAAYIERYKITDNVTDLDAAISAMGSAMKLEVPWSVLPEDRPEGLIALSTSLLERFTRLGDRRDMDRAMQCVEAALRLVPLDSPLQSKYRQTYALTMFSRFRLLNEVKDGDQAIKIYEDLVRTGSDPSLKAVLAQLLVTRFTRGGGGGLTYEDMEDSTPDVDKFIATMGVFSSCSELHSQPAFSMGSPKTT